MFDELKQKFTYLLTYLLTY